jgi:hypothetical protein
MGEIVNLRRVKKRLARADAAVAAQQARVLHGRTAAQKQADQQAQDRARQTVDAAKLTPEQDK